MAIDPLTAGLNLLNKFIKDPAQRQEAQQAMRDAVTESNRQQNAINLEQAKHDSLLVSGPRPFLMWVCGFAVLYTTFGRVFVQDILTFFYKADAVVLTQIDMTLLTTLTISLFGIRSTEVHKGVARKALDLKEGFFSRRRARKGK